MGTPCWEADGVEPDDFFIGRDGKQYPDEEFLTLEEKAAIVKTVLYRQGETVEEHQVRQERAIRAATAARKRAALARRRHAKEACFSCPVRLECLDIALRDGIQHGTWGGYYEEELREIRRVHGQRMKVTER